MTGAIGERERREVREGDRARLIMDREARVVRASRIRTRPAVTTVLESVKIGIPAVGMIENGTEAAETAATGGVAISTTDLPDVTCSTIDLRAVAVRNATTAATEENENGAPHPRVTRSPLLT